MELKKGDRIGLWEIVEKSDYRGSKGTRIYYTCECECGRIRDVEKHKLVSGRSNSCKSCAAKKTTFYGSTKKLSHCYKNIKKKDIGIDDDWIFDYQEFIDWSHENGYAEDKMLKRIDECKPFDKENCRWVDKLEKHGFSKTRLYGFWGRMRHNCNNYFLEGFNGKDFVHIKYCDEWEDFLNFKEWAEKNGYADDLYLSRIDEQDHFTPENCEWIKERKGQYVSYYQNRR